MSIKLTKRIAAQLLKRGESAIRIRNTDLADAGKAITRDDVKTLIKKGSVYAIEEKHNKATSSKIRKIKRAEGRRRGPGKRKGSRKVRQGRSWEKKIRAQRNLLKELRNSKKIDAKTFYRYYLLAKGNSFQNKASIILHLKDHGISISDEELAKINERIKNAYANR